jgi:hypothetical protein
LYLPWVRAQNPGEDNMGCVPVSYGSFFSIWHSDDRCSNIRVK